MALGSFADSPSRGRPVDADVNMVPMIDLLVSTIAFLMLTAVWSHAARLAASAQVPGSPTTGDPPKTTLHVEVAEERFTLAWKQGQAVVRTTDVPREAVTEGGSVRYPALAQAVSREWATRPEPDAQVAVVHVADATRFAELAAVTDAVLATRGADRAPAFAVSLAAR